jgi:uroporphyrinogen decarboxylase
MTYPGLAITKQRVCDVVNDTQNQFDIAVALHVRYRTPWALCAMDLSAEAEAFGCTLHCSENEIPSVVGHLVTNMEQAEKLVVPQPGDMRTSVYLNTVSRLRRRLPNTFVFGSCIGPFSLAARLVGESEAMEMTITEPKLMQMLLTKCTQFITAYACTFKDIGADGLIMAEPTAGLLSPCGLATYSSAHIRQIATVLEDGHFALILHNCGAKLVHLPAILETGVKSFHFGAPMDIVAALNKVPSNVVLCGNLDPIGSFVQLSAVDLATRTRELLAATKFHRNFVISSGCDLPSSVPLANLDAFFETVQGSS